MGLLSSIKQIFSGSASQSGENKGAKTSQHHEHNGYSIETNPLKEGNGYRVQGWIRLDGEEHHFIRADQSHNLEAGHELSLFKAKQCIDQLGQRMFTK